MRKNVKKQLALRVLSTAALMAMVSSIATAAFADTYDLNTGSVTVETKADGYTYVTQEDTEKGGYAQNSKGDTLDGTYKDTDPNGVTITSNGEQTSNTITVNTADKQTTNVTLENVHIEQPDSHWSGNTDPAPIEIKGNGNTNLELDGNNTVFSGNGKHAGIEKADVNGTGTLTIKDDLNDGGKPKTGTDEDTTGKLVVGGYDNGAGIGGGGTDDTACTSNITITGGKITASGGYYGAGIGAGCYGDASNIRIKGNADVAAFADGSAAIGSGYHARGNSDITITDHATVTAASLDGCGIGGGQDASGKVTITISGDATVNAEGVDGTGAIGGGRNSGSKVTVNIKDNANVTAIADGVAIGNNGGGSSTTINITGGTVDAVAHCFNSKPAIGANSGSLNLTVNSSTGKTTINAYNSDDYSPIGTGYTNDITIPASADYDETGTSQLGESNAAVINFYRKATLKTSDFNCPKTLDPYATQIHKRYTLSDKGDLYKVVHNRKYMEEHPDIVDTSKLENSDLHDWQLVDKVAPTLEKDGYADYICNIDNCGQTRHVVLPKLTPEEMREVGVIFWDAAAQAAPAALQGKVLSADEQTTTAAKAQVESLLADKANWKLAEDVGDLQIHPAADAAGTVYEQAVKASGCQYYVIANVTAQ